MSGVPDVEVRLTGGGECEAVHVRTGVVLHTSKSPEYGGRGSSFSSTDLLATALATCIATDLEAVAERNGIALDRIRITASKSLSMKPKRVERLDVRVAIAGTPDELTLQKLRRAADACVVQRSLNGDVEVSIAVVAQQSGG